MYQTDFNREIIETEILIATGFIQRIMFAPLVIMIIIGVLC